MFVDYVMNSRDGLMVQGEVAQHLIGCHWDRGLMRPYFDKKGRNCVTVNTGRTKTVKQSNGIEVEVPIFEKRLVSELMANGLIINGPTSLRKDEWIQFDNKVVMAARQRLRAWTDLVNTSSFGGFNAMGKIMLEHETMNDPGEAFVDMDGMTEGRNDAPKFQLEGIPLPITHSDFWISSRKLAVSRNSGTPLDTAMAGFAGRRVAEKIERTLIGVETGLLFGNTADYGRAPRVYGYLNYPDRILKTDVTVPLGTNASATIDDIIEMRELLYANNFYGPFMVYLSTDWDRWLDQDYILTGGNVATQTLRRRIEAIEGISGVRRLDYLPSSTNPYTIIMVQMTEEVARAINGMDITTVQWQSMGGMRLNFKVMCIQVPQLRSDFNGNCGIAVGTTS